MKKAIFIVVAVAVIFSIYWFNFKSSNKSVPQEPRQQALTVNSHSAVFNTSIDSLMQSYFILHDAFVDGDSIKAKQAGDALLANISKVNVDELKKDTSGIYESANTFLTDVKSSAESLGKQTSLTEMRQDFKSVSENMYPLLKTIHYQGKKLYWQNCPMAFGEDKEANWISNTEEVFNPYLGKNHPEFKSAMLHCGEIKDTIK